MSNELLEDGCRHWISKEIPAGKAKPRELIIISPDGSADETRFFPAGGGWARSMPTEAFLDAYRPVGNTEAKAMFSAASWVQVGGEWMDDEATLRALSTGQSWNGWDVPFFAKQTLLAEIEGSPAMFLGLANARLFFDPDDECFVLVEEIYGNGIPAGIDLEAARRALGSKGSYIEVKGPDGSEMSITRVRPVTLYTPDGPVVAYQVGEGWCWQIAEPAPAPTGP
jgi:hypothetical protein